MVADILVFIVYLKAELNGLRNTVLGVLDYPAELVPVINRLSFAQCAYLLSVYRLETLRFVFEYSQLWVRDFCGQEDKNVLFLFANIQFVNTLFCLQC